MKNALSTGITASQCPFPPRSPGAASSFDGALRRGDASACETFVRAHAGVLLATIRRLLRNEGESAAALQETFAAAFRHMAEGNEVPSRAWMHRAAIEAALARHRARGDRSSPGSRGPLPRFDETGHRVDPRPAWRDVRDDSESDRAAVRACIERLPETYRVVLVMRDVEGLDVATTARLLGVTPNAVKVRLHRARQALRELLDPVFSGDPSSDVALAERGV